MSGEFSTYADAWQPDNETAVRYGCIRITPGTHDTSDPDWIRNPGLYLHTDTAHVSVGINPDIRISKANGHLRIDAPGISNGVPLITGDETAAAKGLLFGASGGGSYVLLRAFRVGHGELHWDNQADYNLIASNTLNLWVAFLSPLVRGTGLASKADRALAAIADLEARVAVLESA